MSTFGGLHIGTSAIHAAQRGLDVTGQNIANSATPGYSRQRVDLEAIGGPGVPAFWSKYDGTGEGVKITGVSRLTDSFLVARANNANANLGNIQEQQKTMAAMERIVGEPSDTGLQKKLAQMWNAFGGAGNSPTVADQAPRAQALERTKDAAGQLNLMASSLETQWQDTGSEVVANVNDVNTMAKDVARLNDAIRNNNIAKVPSNELLDQRDLLISKIADLTGATVRPAEQDQNSPFNSQSVDVFIGGTKLVDGVKANLLTVNDPNAGTYPDSGDPQPVTVQWDTTASSDPHVGNANSGDSGIASGRISGQLKGMNETIPNYMAKFDDIAAKLAETVNSQQAQGFTVEGEAGADLLVAADGGAVTARNIRVPQDAVANSIAVSTGDINGTPAALDGNNARAMSRHIADVGGTDATYKAMVVELGVQAQSVNRNVDVQANVVMKAEDARDSVSGVSLNEEMTNLVQFQHSFSAAAKYVGVIDQTLDTLINMVR
ncbi:flagellar hook-associated protein FlgK [Agilicoccus flavus]|uniref:flagellar hook-associated protein FlgK n=1 Tax=Agilicoccus flavus TaxID=2775968 RepID=UPI001CF6F3FA|nr:flagellar hook-associated protein FlgK [Agilicoccus flavus]